MNIEFIIFLLVVNFFKRGSRLFVSFAFSLISPVIFIKFRPDSDVKAWPDSGKEQFVIWI